MSVLYKTKFRKSGHIIKVDAKMKAKHLMSWLFLEVAEAFRRSAGSFLNQAFLKSCFINQNAKRSRALITFQFFLPSQ